MKGEGLGSPNEKSPYNYTSHRRKTGGGKGEVTQKKKANISGMVGQCISKGLERTEISKSLKIPKKK